MNTTLHKIANKKTSLGLAQFLTVSILVIALVAAALLWQQRRKLTSVQIEGWHHVALTYRDSVRLALERTITDNASVRLSEVEQLVKNFPFVRIVSARRLGSALQILVEEREPIGIVQLPYGTILWVTRDSATIPYAPYYWDCAVPLVSAPSREWAIASARFLRELAAYEKLSAACSNLCISNDGEITCRLEPWGTTVVVGSTDELACKLRHLNWFVETGVLGNNNIRRIDLRWKHRIVFAAMGEYPLSRRNRA